MDQFSIDEIMEMAIRTEALGFQFYTGVAEQFKDDAEMHALFSTLASKEVSHEKTFRDLKANATAEPTPVDWDEVSNYLRAVVESEFFLGRHKSLSDIKQVQSVQDAIRFAIGFEKETLLFFYEMRNLVKEKPLVDAIINEEKSHIRWLDAYRHGFAQ